MESELLPLSDRRVDLQLSAYSSTAYATNTYVTPGPNALRLSRLTAERIGEGMGTRIQRTFLRVEKKARKVAEGKKKGEGKKGEEKKKRSRKEVVNIAPDEGIEDIDEEEDEQYGEFEDDQ
jgi:ATP-dependent DNA helicase Q1